MNKPIVKTIEDLQERLSENGSLPEPLAEYNRNKSITRSRKKYPFRGSGKPIKNISKFEKKERTAAYGEDII